MIYLLGQGTCRITPKSTSPLVYDHALNSFGRFQMDCIARRIMETASDEGVSAVNIMYSPHMGAPSTALYLASILTADGLVVEAREREELSVHAPSRTRNLQSVIDDLRKKRGGGVIVPLLSQSTDYLNAMRHQLGRELPYGVRSGQLFRIASDMTYDPEYVAPWVPVEPQIKIPGLRSRPAEDVL